MNRRHFLQTTTAAALPAFTSSRATALAKATRIIDTHTHFYDPTRPEGVPWPEKGSKLYRKVMPTDWLAVAEPHGVTQTVVVEASKWLEDNQWILDLAKEEKSIVGFVGRIDPEQADFEAHLKRFSANPIFRGVRWSGNAFMKPELKTAVLAGAKLLANHGLELDVNGPPDSLSAVAQLATAAPDLRLIINHLGSSGDPQALKPAWQEGIRVAAKCPNVWMKVSALVEQAKGAEGAAPKDASYYLPILNHLWDCFGPDRLVYGSNWPVSDRGGSYKTVINLVSEFFSSKGQEACEKYFWRNSQDVYRWIER